MKKLLNSLYITDETAYLSLDGENIVCRIDSSDKFRIPIVNVESIFCFSYLGCSPVLMGKCVENKIPINFISPSGKFLAKVTGETKGNVHLRIKQMEVFSKQALLLAANTVACKISNAASLIKRSVHDNSQLREDSEIENALSALSTFAKDVYSAKDIASIMGIEGSAASAYFRVFNKLISSTADGFTFTTRTKRPPLDKVNAMLSFLYTIATSDFAAALEAVGLDSYIGFFHSLRSGRASLACDLVEEYRHVIERLVLTMINLKMVSENDFDTQVSGAVQLNDEGRKKVLTQWQQKKRTEIVHPYLGQKVQYGLIPYVQSCLLAKYIRGEIDEYPCFVNKQR